MLVVSGVAINRYRGEAIALTGRNITWGEIAEKSEMSEVALRAIRNGKSSGSTRSLGRLSDAYNSYGLNVTLGDLLIEMPDSS